MSANNDFKKDFFKLMNNAVLGKTMENVRNDRDIKLNNKLSKKKLSSYNNFFFFFEKIY